MTTWELSDGTKVHLGGKVEGESTLALLLRQESEDARDGRPPSVFLEPMPCAPTPMDMDNAQHVNQWVRNTARCLRVAVLSAPDVPPIEGEPAPARHVPNVLN